MPVGVKVILVDNRGKPMNLRSRNLIALGVVTLIAVIAASWAVVVRYDDSEVFKREGGVVFPGLRDKVRAIDSVEISRSSGTFILKRQPEGWANLGVGGYPARQSRIEKMIGGLVTLSYFEPRTARSKLYPKIGVEKLGDGAKSTRLLVKDDGGEVLADLLVGNPKANVPGLDQDGVYIRIPGETQSWLAEGILDVRHDVADWSNRTIIDLKPGDISFLSVKHSDGHIVELYRKTPDDPDLTIKNLPAGAKIEHQYQIDYMAGLMESLRFENANPIEVTDFDGGPRVEAVVISSDGREIRLSAGDQNEDGASWVKLRVLMASNFPTSKNLSETVKTLSARVDGWAFLLPRAKVERLKIRLSDILNRDTISDGKGN